MRTSMQTFPDLDGEQVMPNWIIEFVSEAAGDPCWVLNRLASGPCGFARPRCQQLSSLNPAWITAGSCIAFTGRLIVCDVVTEGLKLAGKDYGTPLGHLSLGRLTALQVSICCQLATAATLSADVDLCICRTRP